MEDFKWEKKEIKVCKEDLVVVFNFGRLLKPCCKRTILNWIIKKLPSRVVEFDW